MTKKTKADLQEELKKTHEQNRQMHNMEVALKDDNERLRVEVKHQKDRARSAQNATDKLMAKLSVVEQENDALKKELGITRMVSLGFVVLAVAWVVITGVVS